jgi:peptidoglycan/LPS O-acetylase OafA/YrhL
MHAASCGALDVIFNRRPVTDKRPSAGGTYPGQRNLGLDAMRAAAILLVMIAHWSNNISIWFGAKPDPRVFFTADLGIDLFFALSGYLIGRILIEEGRRDASFPNLTVFLVRRWMRTLPLYFLVIAALLVLVPPPELPLRYALKYATLTQNLWKPLPPGWWFAVSWSLAVEEWFYLLFGIAVFAYYRLFRAAWAIWLPIGFFILQPLLMRLAFPEYPGMGSLVPFRLDEIAYGAAMAQLHSQRSAVFRHPILCLVLGLTLIGALGLGFWLGPASLRPVLISPATVIGCALLLPAALKWRSAPAVVAWLLTQLSAKSYALYLVHLTILEHVAQRLFYAKAAPPAICVAIAILAPFAVAALTGRLIETPIMRLRPKHRAGPELDAATPSIVDRAAA